MSHKAVCFTNCFMWTLISSLTQHTWKWEGKDSNLRRHEANRFTVCPGWPLRYPPVVGLFISGLLSLSRDTLFVTDEPSLVPPNSDATLVSSFTFLNYTRRDTIFWQTRWITLSRNPNHSSHKGLVAPTVLTPRVFLYVGLQAPERWFTRSISSGATAFLTHKTPIQRTISMELHSPMTKWHIPHHRY